VNIQPDDYYLCQNGKFLMERILLKDIKEMVTLDIILKVNGGKGGFGA
jgi:hypothetical protein